MKYMLLSALCLLTAACSSTQVASLPDPKPPSCMQYSVKFSEAQLYVEGQNVKLPVVAPPGDVFTALTVQNDLASPVAVTPEGDSLIIVAPQGQATWSGSTTEVDVQQSWDQPAPGDGVQLQATQCHAGLGQARPKP